MVGSSSIAFGVVLVFLDKDVYEIPTPDNPLTIFIDSPGKVIISVSNGEIATAAYGSEMAPQVQLLREIRDNQLMNTESGKSFMSGFNELYYSFSPTIADMQRESPMFKEAVKLGLTPMLSSLAIMENANSESEVLGLGLSVIALNMGMYIAAPALIGIKVHQQIKSRK